MKITLKKILLFLCIQTSLVSCSTLYEDFDDLIDVVPVEQNYFNPPSWTHGKWVPHVEVDNPFIIYQFKPHDYLELDGSTGLGVGFTALIIGSQDMPGERMSVTEPIITNEKYNFRINIENGQYHYYNFTYINENKILSEYLDINELTLSTDTLVRYNR